MELSENYNVLERILSLSQIESRAALNTYSRELCRKSQTIWRLQDSALAAVHTPEFNSGTYNTIVSPALQLCFLKSENSTLHTIWVTVSFNFLTLMYGLTVKLYPRTNFQSHTKSFPVQFSPSCYVIQISGAWNVNSKPKPKPYKTGTHLHASKYNHMIAAQCPLISNPVFSADNVVLHDILCFVRRDRLLKYSAHVTNQNTFHTIDCLSNTHYLVMRHSLACSFTGTPKTLKQAQQTVQL